MKITARNNELHITGFESRADTAVDVLQKLLLMAEEGNTITEQNVRYLLDLTDEERLNNHDLPFDLICLTYRGKPIKSKTYNQKRYVDAIRRNPVVFGIGPAGTGKLFLQWQWL